MSLARAWRRQLYGASSAALIVPSAMLAALVVLALGGGFGQVGVLGQIFAGPPAPSVGGGGASGSVPAAVARALPAIPAVALRPSTPPARHRAAPVAPVRAGSRRGGGALVPVGGVAPIVNAPVRAPVPSRPVPIGSGSGSAPSRPSPQPVPAPQPTVVDQVVKTVTPVTQQLPAPAGPAVTQAVQAVGSAVPGVKLP